MSRFILLYVHIQVFQHHLFKRLSFTQSWHPCQRLVDHVCMDLFLGSLYFCSISLCVCFCQYHIVWTALYCRLKSGSVAPPAFFFFKISLVIQGLLWFYTNFRIFFSFSMKDAIGISIGITLNQYIALGRPFNNINSCNPWSWDIFSFICEFFNFFHQCLIVFSVPIFHLLG